MLIKLDSAEVAWPQSNWPHSTIQSLKRTKGIGLRTSSIFMRQQSNILSVISVSHQSPRISKSHMYSGFWLHKAKVSLLLLATTLHPYVFQCKPKTILSLNKSRISLSLICETVNGMLFALPFCPMMCKRCKCRTEFIFQPVSLLSIRKNVK